MFILTFGCLESLFPPEIKPFSADAQKYYELKNLSCDTLSGDFLIVTHDISAPSISGLIETIPGELEIAQNIAEDYSFNQTTKTYLLNDEMKRVVITEDQELTTIWKDGRIYNCTPNCTMRVMTQQESDEYYTTLNAIKTTCAHFGKTELSPSITLEKLLHIEYTGKIDTIYSHCDNFLISGNKTYAEELLAIGEFDEETFLWIIAHLDGPINECLDESTGIITFRNLSLDLTNVYLFNYTDGGYMKVNQQTELLYFTNDVPQSFLALPSQS